MMREDVQHHEPVLDAAARRNLVAEHYFRAVVVHSRGKVERPGLARQSARAPHVSSAARVDDRPARKAARNLLHVLLRIAAVNAQRVQLHQLARIILINAAPLTLLLLRSGLLLLGRTLRRVLSGSAGPRVCSSAAHHLIGEEAAQSALRAWAQTSARPSSSIRARALKIVEIEKHGGALGGRH